MPDFQQRPRPRPDRQGLPPRPRQRPPGPGRGNGAANDRLPRQGDEVDQQGVQEGGGQQGGQQGGEQGGDAQAQGQEHGALATAERTRVAAAAVSALSTEARASNDADLVTRIELAVQAAAVAAFDACVAEALATNDHSGQQATQDEVSTARSAYDAGPGIAVGKFGDYLDDIRGEATATDSHREQALTRYATRTQRSVSTYSGIAANDSVALLGSHISGVVDGANAEANIQDIVEGSQIERSGYGNAPGGEVEPNDTVLQAIATLADTYSFRITELAGGSHSRNSAHYPGDAIDVDRIDGAGVTSRNGSLAGFMQACRDLGASLVLGPGDSGHDTHVHAQW